MKHIFVINPTSGRGKAYKQIAIIEEVFKDNPQDFEIIITEHQGHATEIARRFKRSDEVTLYSVGGDGTAYELLNGLQEKVAMAIIPAGTGNDYYRMVGYKNQNLKELIRDTVHGREVIVDYGLANDRRFLNMMALGLDAETNQVAQDIGKKLPIPRSLVYAISALAVIVRPKKLEIELTINDQVINRKVLLVAIMNGRWYGGGFQPTPKASIQDGLFDVLLIDSIPIHRILKLLPRYFKGTHVNEDVVEFFKADALKIKTPGLSPVSCDGETSKQEEINFKLIKNGMVLRVPQASTLK